MEDTRSLVFVIAVLLEVLPATDRKAGLAPWTAFARCPGGEGLIDRLLDKTLQ